MQAVHDDMGRFALFGQNIEWGWEWTEDPPSRRTLWRAGEDDDEDDYDFGTPE